MDTGYQQKTPEVDPRVLVELERRGLIKGPDTYNANLVLLSSVGTYAKRLSGELGRPEKDCVLPAMLTVILSTGDARSEELTELVNGFKTVSTNPGVIPVVSK